jgi:hypothetical protein
MPDEPLNAEQLLAQLQQRAQQGAQEHSKNVEDLIEYGRTTQGSQAFDDASEVFVSTLGQERAQVVLADLVKFNAPDRVLMDLTNDTARLERFSKLTAHQQAVEIARMEAQYASHGHVETGTTPAWKATHKNGGRVSDADWAHNYGANLSDKQWDREFDRRHAARMEKRGGRW